MTDWQKRHLNLEVTHPKIQEMADHAQNLAKWFAKDDKTQKTVLVLAGETGCGKTHTSKSLYRWARSHSGRVGATSTWVAWPEACKTITEGYDGCIQDMIEADFLALDDIGAETDRYKTGALIGDLALILSRRERKFTVLTTNISPAKWNERFDIRVADRLLRNTVICDLADAPSYSLTKLLGV